MCNKVAYESKSAAIQHAEFIRKSNRKLHQAKSKKSYKRLRPYLCLFCNKWHLTSQKKLKYSRRPAV